MHDSTFQADLDFLATIHAIENGIEQLIDQTCGAAVDTDDAARARKQALLVSLDRQMSQLTVLRRTI